MKFESWVENLPDALLEKLDLSELRLVWDSLYCAQMPNIDARLLAPVLERTFPADSHNVYRFERLYHRDQEVDLREGCTAQFSVYMPDKPHTDVATLYYHELADMEPALSALGHSDLFSLKPDIEAADLNQYLHSALSSFHTRVQIAYNQFKDDLRTVKGVRRLTPSQMKPTKDSDK